MNPPVSFMNSLNVQRQQSSGALAISEITFKTVLNWPLSGLHEDYQNAPYIGFLVSCIFHKHKKENL